MTNAMLTAAFQLMLYLIKGQCPKWAYSVHNHWISPISQSIRIRGGSVLPSNQLYLNKKSSSYLTAPCNVPLPSK